jgi:hypothetical protein
MLLLLSCTLSHSQKKAATQLTMYQLVSAAAAAAAAAAAEGGMRQQTHLHTLP